jgi:hypothetical protein
VERINAEFEKEHRSPILSEYKLRFKKKFKDIISISE